MMKHVAGCYYHVYNRGCNREHIFTSDENYLFLLRRIQEYRSMYQVTFVAHCLMPNHYHFLLRPEKDDVISPFIQRLFNSYTQAFNKQQGCSGTLFEGRVQSVHVDRDEYLNHVCRYIHLNPVVAGLVSDPAGWQYSNYLEWMGLRPGTLVDREFVRDRFQSAERYRKYVLNVVESAHDDGARQYFLD